MCDIWWVICAAYCRMALVFAIMHLYVFLQKYFVAALFYIEKEWAETVFRFSFS